MTDILLTTWAAVIALLSGALSVLEVCVVWVGDIFYHLHVDAPRLEGLLIGVVLTWILLRRDRHPILRVLSAPLKLIVDILDLAWDQTVEVVSDAVETVRGWIDNLTNYVKGLFIKVYSRTMSALNTVKKKLTRKKDA